MKFIIAIAFFLSYFTGWSFAKAASLSAKTGISSLWMSELQARRPWRWLPQVSSEMPETP